MTNRFFPEKQINNARVARPVSGRVFVWLAVIAVAGTLLSSGFVISARQHFQAVSLGYQSEELRRQASQLDEKRRQLELEHARATSPVEIERRAEKIGLKRPVPEVRPDSQAKNIRRPALAAGDKKKR
ncbi:MAG TPA: hypothetical protein VNH22_16530 [Blastocatellia bacterium]|jgi:hypothetical protein|nr:hypothetical protein [Blastocatellia bacterium]